MWVKKLITTALLEEEYTQRNLLTHYSLKVNGITTNSSQVTQKLNLSIPALLGAAE